MGLARGVGPIFGAAAAFTQAKFTPAPIRLTFCAVKVAVSK